MTDKITASGLNDLVAAYYENIQNAIVARCEYEYFFELPNGNTERSMGWKQSMQKLAEKGNTSTTLTLPLNNEIIVDGNKIPPVTLNQISAQEVFDIVSAWWPLEETDENGEVVKSGFTLTLKGSSDRYEHSIWFTVNWGEAEETDKSVSKELTDAINTYNNNVKNIYFNSFNDKYGDKDSIVGVYWLPTLLWVAENEGKNYSTLSYDIDHSILNENMVEPGLETIKSLLVQWWKKKDEDFIISFDVDAYAEYDPERPYTLHFSVTWNK